MCRIYKLIQEYSIKQHEVCYALDINQELNMLAISCNKSINIFEFRNFKLNLLQILIEHTNLVFCLSFMKKSNQLISCGNNQIIIWQINEYKQLICKQKLEGHANVVRCVLYNNTEDLIISGSDDMKIKFWHISQEWYCRQTIEDHTKSVLALSLNEQQNKLISCSHDKQILLSEISEQTKKWTVKQKINLEQYGFRLCFINNDIFTFQPNNIEQMYIFEIQNEKIVKKSELNIFCGYDNYSLFPQKYIQAKGLLISKNGCYVHIIKFEDNNLFTLKQSINFGTQILYGIVSDDGNYLITWDQISKQVQVRKQIEI
ncbi:unnamed protein product [Paramecium sonneborni]|uniref:Uncharacterized protein n=1 Tax=Paramecium sonneborni TaxID=65129 RepID=A0A8S1M4I8_9CILI|nr:unnamed protein product [Paramecium sonneborni]